MLKLHKIGREVVFRASQETDMSKNKTASNPFYRLVSPGVIHYTAGHGSGTMRLFVEIDYRDGRLSITGVEGPMSNGDCRGSCGQTGISEDLVPDAAEGWDAGKVQKLRDIWERWHLNDMRAGCSHQRKHWNFDEQLEVVEYGLTKEAREMRGAAQKIACRAAIAGEVASQLSATDRALLALESAYRSTHQPPDADSPLSGCYEPKKREIKAAGWVTPSEHPEGLLTKPCPTCGYAYGSAWLKEDVPASVLGFLRRLKDAGYIYAWSKKRA